MIANLMRDRGGTRSGTERRSSRVIYVRPDRRTGNDRRSGSDRREGAGRYRLIERRDIFKK